MDDISEGRTMDLTSRDTDVPDSSLPSLGKTSISIPLRGTASESSELILPSPTGCPDESVPRAKRRRKGGFLSPRDSVTTTSPSCLSLSLREPDGWTLTLTLGLDFTFCPV